MGFSILSKLIHIAITDPECLNHQQREKKERLEETLEHIKLAEE